jgi:hypothetical protein
MYNEQTDITRCLYLLLLLQASTDLSVLDFDIPLAFGFAVTSAIELATIIIVIASVTWQVLIVGIFATIATKYYQVNLALYFSRFCLKGQN